MQTPSPSGPTSADPGGRRSRIRRGDRTDKALLVQEAVDIALGLYREGGIDAVSMRAVTKAMGLSATALYNHLADKSELLRALWASVLDELLAHTSAARDGAPTARAALRASTEAYLAYYEENPQHFRLLFMTEQTVSPGSPARWQEAPIYRDVLDAALALNRALALEIGGDAGNAQLAHELRHCLLTGYLHARLINTRNAWSNLPALRAQIVDTVMASVEHCLLQRRDDFR